MKDTNNNKRIATNTLYLYIRMLITMAVSLYSSRIVLDVLGVEDYGIYGIVGSVVVLFSFISNAMTGASQRFFSYELGKTNNSRIKEIFGVSILAHILIIFIVLVLGETIGLWYMLKIMNLPESRFWAAQIVYQLTILSFLFSIIRIPYNAIIVSYEHMSFFAYMSILEVVLKLLVLYLLKITTGDMLVVYGILILAVTIICTLAYVLYCQRKFVECKPKIYWDKKMFGNLMSFTGWTLCGNVANVAAQQGGNLLLNSFFTVAVNAAYSLGNQVSSAVYGLVTNFQLAFRPQIVKLYAAGNTDELYMLIYRASRFSFYLLLLIAVPFIINADYIFSLWLKSVPEYSVLFCQLFVCYCLIDSIQAPLWMLIDATGNIKTYAIWLSAMLILNIPISYVVLLWGGSPASVILVRVILNLITAIVRVGYIKKFINFPSMEYIRQTYICIIVCLLVFALGYLIKDLCLKNDISELYSLIFSTLTTVLFIIIIGMNKKERSLAFNMIISRFK